MSAIISVQLEADLKNRVDDLALLSATDSGALVGDVVRHYLEVYASDVGAIQEGMRDAEAGRLVDHSQLVAWVASWRGGGEVERPKCG